VGAVRIKFGTYKPAEGPEEIPVFWDSEKVMNSHFTVIGPSGSGKTTRLRRLMAGMSLVNSRIRFVVLDPHGDMGVSGEDSFRFSATSELGLNPLTVREDPDYGGVTRAIETFLKTISRTSRPLGSKQEHTLHNILLDLYAYLGFHADRPETWNLRYDDRRNPEMPKRHPTVKTLKWFMERKMTQVFLGTSSETVAALDDLSRKLRSMDRAIKKEIRGEETSVDIDKLKDRCRELFERFLEGMSDGQEVSALFRYGNKEVLQSCYERICNLERSGLFRADTYEFDPAAAIWRYDLSALSSDGQRMAVDFILDDIFAAARGEGQKPETVMFVLLDESHKFVSPEADHIISVWAREARKFGLGLILSSQNLTDFPDEILAQMGTKFVLGVDPIFLDRAAKKLKVEPRRLEGIQTHKSSIIAIKNKGDSGTRWLDMTLV
jgi:DNA helicase HerA-like ATPase